MWNRKQKRNTWTNKTNSDIDNRKGKGKSHASFSREERSILLSDFKKFIKPQLIVGRITVIKDMHFLLLLAFIQRADIDLCLKYSDILLLFGTAPHSCSRMNKMIWGLPPWGRLGYLSLYPFSLNALVAGSSLLQGELVFLGPVKLPIFLSSLNNLSCALEIFMKNGIH